MNNTDWQNNTSHVTEGLKGIFCSLLPPLYLSLSAVGQVKAVSGLYAFGGAKPYAVEFARYYAGIFEK